MKEVDLLLHGVGHVGRALLRLLTDKERLRRHGLNVRIVGAVDSRGGVWAAEGIAPADLLEAKQSAAADGRLCAREETYHGANCNRWCWASGKFAGNHVSQGRISCHSL